MDLTGKTDAELFADAAAIREEQERRVKLAQLPDQLADMARDAAAAGCDRDDLLARVTDALTPEEQAALEA